MKPSPIRQIEWKHVTGLALTQLLSPPPAGKTVSRMLDKTNAAFFLTSYFRFSSKIKRRQSEELPFGCLIVY